MSAPSEDQILEKAKELCRSEGRAWNLDDFKNGVSGSNYAHDCRRR